MVSHLHPRSRSTMSLFTGCLAVSFLVVGMPHILPCPVDRRQFNDSGDPAKRPRRRKAQQEAEQGQLPEVASMARVESEVVEDKARRRECPVPKPRGLIGQIMGFPEDKDRDGAVVVVKSVEEARARRRQGRSGQSSG